MNGPSNRTDTYQATVERDEEDLRLTEVLEAYLADLERGAAPDRQTFLARHPDLADQLSSCLDGLEIARRIGTEMREDSGDEPPHDSSTMPKQFGDFQILREAGRGGMGVVYEAEQQSLRRRVALKILPLAAVMDPRNVQRFQNEVQAAALLNHTNIVPIYSVGVERGVHYYAMQYVDGHTLEEWISQQRVMAGFDEETDGKVQTHQDRFKKITATLTADYCPEPRTSSSGDRASRGEPVIEVDIETKPMAMLATSKQSGRASDRFNGVCKLIIQAAEALDHAHNRGVLHRDVKPGNLMVDGTGTLWITDFGLARLEADVGMTMTGDIVGTLRYMSPEQALAKRVVVDHRTDIYSLGATLYELLTLKPVVVGEDRAEVLRQIALEEPRSPCQVNRAVPRDLGTIVLKAISKAPEDRYTTAREFADDLRHYLAHEPIKAKRPTWMTRAAKWTRRHRALSWAAIVVLVVTTLASTVSTVLISDFYRREKTQRERAELLMQTAEDATTRAEQLTYTANMRLAGQAWQDDDMRQVAELLEKHRPKPGKPDLRGYEWLLLDQAARCNSAELASYDLPLYDVNYSPNGRWIAVTGADGFVRFHSAKNGALRWSLATEHGETNSVAFSHDGQLFATAGDDGMVKIWQFKKRHLLHSINAHDQAYDVCFTPDSKLLASAGHDGVIRLWDCGSGNPIGALQGHTRAVERIAISSDGKLLASAGRDRTARIWDLGTRRELRAINDSNPFLSAAFALDNSWIATVGKSHGLCCWDVHTGKQLFFLPAAGHRSPLRSVAISANGCWLATGGSGGVIRLWHSLSYKGTPEEPKLDHDIDQTITWQEVASHTGRVYGLAFSPDSRELASVGHDGRLSRLQLKKPRDHFQERAKPAEPVALAAIADHDLIAIAGKKGVHLTRPSDGKIVRALTTDKIDWKCVAADRDRHRLAAGTSAGEVRVWDVPSGAKLRQLQLKNNPIDHLAFVPDANILGASVSGEFRVIDLEKGELIRNYAARRHQCWAFSPDGTHVAVAIPDINAVEIWDRQRDVYRMTLPGQAWGMERLTFSPDCRLLAAADSGRNLIVWDLADEATQFSNVAHDRRISSLQFTADGKTILTASDDGRLRFWHVASGQRLFDLHITNGHSIIAAEICNGGKYVVYIDEGRRSGERMLCFGQGVMLNP